MQGVDESAVLALVAQVGQRDVGLVGPLIQRGEQAGERLGP